MIFDAINNKGKILITQKLKDNCNVQLVNFFRLHAFTKFNEITGPIMHMN